MCASYSITLQQAASLHCRAHVHTTVHTHIGSNTSRPPLLTNRLQVTCHSAVHILVLVDVRSNENPHWHRASLGPRTGC